MSWRSSCTDKPENRETLLRRGRHVTLRSKHFKTRIFSAGNQGEDAAGRSRGVEVEVCVLKKYSRVKNVTRRLPRNCNHLKKLMKQKKKREVLFSQCFKFQNIQRSFFVLFFPDNLRVHLKGPADLFPESSMMFLFTYGIASRKKQGMDEIYLRKTTNIFISYFFFGGRRRRHFLQLDSTNKFYVCQKNVSKL